MSSTGYCLDCGNARRAENLIALVTHSGPDFDHWRRRMAASVGGVLLDERTDTA